MKHSERLGRSGSRNIKDVRNFTCQKAVNKLQSVQHMIQKCWNARACMLFLSTHMILFSRFVYRFVVS
jgi:hypothetical protein